LTEIDAIIDLDRYPIADPASPEAQALVARGRAQFLADGCFVLDGFIRADRIEDPAAEARALMVDGFYRSRERDPEEGRRSGCFAWHRTTRASMRGVGGDRMAADSPFLQIHRWDPMTRFIAAVLERET
tara:strand:+ start:533 stop:919 length:387 start_codon:yes stop_codon:yes gene_type:complete